MAMGIFGLPIGLVLLFAASARAASVHWQTFSGTTHYLKRITPAVYVSGRLTSRQLGYVSEAGFKTVISLVDFPNRDDVFKGIEGEWPSSAEEADILKGYGANSVSLNVDMTQQSFDEVSSAILSAQKPIIVHCEVRYWFYLCAMHFSSITFLYFYSRGGCPHYSLNCISLKPAQLPQRIYTITP